MACSMSLWKVRFLLFILVTKRGCTYNPWSTNPVNRTLQGPVCEDDPNGQPMACANCMQFVTPSPIVSARSDMGQSTNNGLNLSRMNEVWVPKPTDGSCGPLQFMTAICGTNQFITLFTTAKLKWCDGCPPQPVQSCQHGTTPTIVSTGSTNIQSNPVTLVAANERSTPALSCLQSVMNVHPSSGASMALVVLYGTCAMLIGPEDCSSKQEIASLLIHKLAGASVPSDQEIKDSIIAFRNCMYGSGTIDDIMHAGIKSINGRKLLRWTDQLDIKAITTDQMVKEGKYGLIINEKEIKAAMKQSIKDAKRLEAGELKYNDLVQLGTVDYIAAFAFGGGKALFSTATSELLGLGIFMGLLNTFNNDAIADSLFYKERGNCDSDWDPRDCLVAERPGIEVEVEATSFPFQNSSELKRLQGQNLYRATESVTTSPKRTKVLAYWGTAFESPQQCVDGVTLLREVCVKATEEYYKKFGFVEQAANIVSTVASSLAKTYAKLWKFNPPPPGPAPAPGTFNKKWSEWLNELEQESLDAGVQLIKSVVTSNDIMSSKGTVGNSHSETAQPAQSFIQESPDYCSNKRATTAPECWDSISTGVTVAEECHGPGSVLVAYPYMEQYVNGYEHMSSSQCYTRACMDCLKVNPSQTGDPCTTVAYNICAQCCGGSK